MTRAIKRPCAPLSTIVARADPYAYPRLRRQLIKGPCPETCPSGRLFADGEI